MELAKKCPFLARVPSSFVRKARGPVLVSYAERCPVMSEVLNKTSEVPEKNESEGKFLPFKAHMCREEVFKNSDYDTEPVWS